jgi:hypothetical protein
MVATATGRGCAASRRGLRLMGAAPPSAAAAVLIGAGCGCGMGCAGDDGLECMLPPDLREAPTGESHPDAEVSSAACTHRGARPDTPLACPGCSSLALAAARPPCGLQQAARMGTRRGAVRTPLSLLRPRRRAPPPKPRRCAGRGRPPAAPLSHCWRTAGWLAGWLQKQVASLFDTRRTTGELDLTSALQKQRLYRNPDFLEKMVRGCRQGDGALACPAGWQSASA